MKRHCCAMMAQNIDPQCDQHPDPANCPDALIAYSEKYDSYGIWVRDGGSSYIAIEYCPWCGTKLPSSRRDEWFETLERMGYDDPDFQDIPPEFESDAWYRGSS